VPNVAAGQDGGVDAVVEPGRVLAGRYRLLERLGRGGFGVVWRAEDAVLEREVAVKTLALAAPDETALARFEREARALARLDHPNVVAVFDSGFDGGTAYMVMQLVSGPSLATVLAEEGPLPIDRELDYGAQAAAGLAAAHAAGLVHRDVSPANLLLDRGDVVKLVDFGIARLVEGSMTLTATGTVFATPGYVAPEQAEGRPADARSDLYALGCVLYALLTGDPPFLAEHPLGVIQQHLTQPPLPLPARRADVPAELDRLVRALLAKDPRDRPGDAGEVARRLEAVRRAGAATATVPLPQRPRGPRWGRAALLAAGIVLVALGAILATTLTGRGGTPPRTAAVPPTTTTPPPTATTSPTTTAATTPPPAAAASQTPAQAIAAARAAIAQAQSGGLIDPAAASDLGRRLDDIARALQHPNPNDAAHKVGDLLGRVGELVGDGRLTPGGSAEITVAVDRLAALLAAGSGPTDRPRPHGHGKPDDGNG
jgi:serine/threonine-protein kinase